jgi:hypothetical protein
MIYADLRMEMKPINEAPIRLTKRRHSIPCNDHQVKRVQVKKKEFKKIFTAWNNKWLVEMRIVGPFQTVMTAYSTMTYHYYDELYPLGRPG